MAASSARNLVSARVPLAARAVRRKAPSDRAAQPAAVRERDVSIKPKWVLELASMRYKCKKCGHKWSPVIGRSGSSWTGLAEVISALATLGTMAQGGSVSRGIDWLKVAGVAADGVHNHVAEMCPECGHVGCKILLSKAEREELRIEHAEREAERKREGCWDFVVYIVWIFFILPIILMYAVCGAQC